MTGKQIEIDDARGLVVVLEFFAEYCESCVRSLSMIDHLNQQYPDVLFVAVSLDELESAARAMERETGVALPIVYDGGLLGARLGVTTLPTTMVVDRAGVVRWVVAGQEVVEEDLRAVVDTLK